MRVDVLTGVEVEYSIYSDFPLYRYTFLNNEASKKARFFPETRGLCEYQSGNARGNPGE
jgi:hypothetical protein